MDKGSTTATASGSVSARPAARRGLLFDSDTMLMEKVSTGYSLPPLPDSSLEEIMLDKMDLFLGSLEERLNQFETYLRSIDGPTPPSLATIYSVLLSIRDQVLETASVGSRFDALAAILDEHYGALLPSTLLPERLLMGFHFLEAKLSQVDRLLDTDTFPLTLIANEVYLLERVATQFLRCFNFDYCMQAAKTRALHYYELPLPWRENKYIIHGYRFDHGVWSAWRLLMHWHNETCNIWSHLLGAVVLMALGAWHYPSTAVSHSASPGTQWIVYGYLAAGVACLGLSVCWHTYCLHLNARLRMNCACVDYTGITVLITMLIILLEYAALYHYPRWQVAMVGFLLVCGFSGLAFNWLPYFDRPDSRPLRIGFFVLLAALGAFSAVVLAYHKGVVHALRYFTPVLKSLALYAIGVVFYGLLIPERWRSDYTLFVDPEEVEREQEDLQKGWAVVDEQVQERVLGGNTPVVPMPTPRRGLAVSILLAQNHLTNLFNKELVSTPHAGSWWLLWWVDYVMLSHSIWHLFVLAGILTHYSAMLAMLARVDVNAPGV